MYAADRSSPTLWFFSVHAAPEPSVMPRLLDLFAKRGLVPRRLHAGADEHALAVDLQVAGLDDAQADRVAALMRQTVGVERVLASAMHERASFAQAAR
jgi:hypothetical protein